MSILPKYTFLFNSIPLDFPKIWFKKVDGLFSSFIWGNKRPRIALKKFRRKKAHGGIATPDLYLYFCAFHLKNFLQLSMESSTFSPLYKALTINLSHTAGFFLLKFGHPRPLTQNFGKYSILENAFLFLPDKKK